MSPTDVLVFLIESVRWSCIAVVFVALVATILAETSYGAWFVRVCDFPRLQIMVATLLAGAAVPVLHVVFRDQLTTLDWVTPTVALPIAARQLMWIWPYLPVAEKHVEDARGADEASTLRILASNVLQHNEEFGRWRRVVGEEEADVIVVAETDQVWVDEIDKLLGKTHPHRTTVPLSNLYGMAVWSRLPTSDVDVAYAVQKDIPSVHLTVELRCGQKVRVHVVHPRPPAPQESETSSPRDAELILLGRRIADATDGGDALPTVVCGDLNDVAWSRTTRLFLRLSGLLDLRRGRGLYSTFHAGHWWVRFPLDHIFVDRRFRLVEMRVLEDVGSDHFPIYAAIAFDASAAEEQNGLEKTSEDEDEANDRLERERQRQHEVGD
ncbi:MAG: endonuclease/exonuclease/phosphatase family protein [Planctomycetota bacterium]